MTDRNALLDQITHIGVFAADLKVIEVRDSVTPAEATRIGVRAALACLI